MMAGLFEDDFLLETSTARELYHEHAERQPIIDYHCHLPPAQVAEDQRFQNLAEIWLHGDHYKWRALRANGEPEQYCTGSASDWEKFQAWARTVPCTLRNPLHHWTHLELARVFGIRRWLDSVSARDIYQQANEQLSREGYSTQGLLRKFRVLVLCTTDDPVDSLEHHDRYAGSPGARHTRMYPAWRPDRALGVDAAESFNTWLDQLAQAAGMDIVSYDDFMTALERRHEFFHQRGCRLSDHGLEVPYSDGYTLSEVRATFERARARQQVVIGPADRFRSAVLYELALLNHRRGWAQQFHLGALRNNNGRMFQTLGPDTGFDSIGDRELARPLSRLLDRLDTTDQLAPTILYNLNPRDNEMVAAMAGNFQDGSKPGKMQYGAAWWFLDQLDGMEKQLNTLSNLGLLARFVGMLTDSRSFLSYPRHEYFRRLLCNLLGNDVERGLLPNDRELLAGLVEDVCFRNARDYFGLPLPEAYTEK